MCLNKSSSHWLLFDALQYAITMCLKCREGITNVPPQVNLIDDDFEIAFELALFVRNIKEVCGLKKLFFHNMPCLILDPKTISLCLVSLFISHGEGVNIVEEYHK